MEIPLTQSESQKSKYFAPEIRVLDEQEVLKVFQVTSAGSGWWCCQGMASTT